MSLVTIAQAARILELSEGQVKSAMKRGDLEMVAGGGTYKILFDETSVRQYGVRRKIGEGARSQRQIILIGAGLDAIDAALVAAGLVPIRAATVLEAMRVGDAKGFPITLCGVRVVEQELALVKPLLGEIAMIVVVRDIRRVPWEIEPQIKLADPDELRRISSWCWGQVRKRHEAVTLEL